VKPYLVINTKFSVVNQIFGMAIQRQTTGQSLTSAQCRAVRAWHGWSQDDLAARASVSVNSVRNFENDNTTVHPNTIAAIRGAIEAAGISLLFNEQGDAIGMAIGKEPRRRSRSS
jgi:transcriptional regulator with XRE-family HTH domain